MRDTDATGVIYFASQLQMGLEVFEEYAHSEQFHLQKMIEEGEFLLPIVHAQADFSAPIILGQELNIEWHISKIGNRSFTHTSHFFCEGKEAGVTSLVHAVIAQKTKQAIAIPQMLLNLLNPMIAPRK